MATLYEIDQQIAQCVRMVTEEVFDKDTGEIVEMEVEEAIDPDALDALLIERDKKIENVALWMKNLRAEAEAIKAEKLKLGNRQKNAEKNAEDLKRYLDRALCGEKFRTPRVQISYRKSSNVQIDDGAVLPDEYLRYKEPEPDKNALKKALKDGAEIDGVRLEERLNMQVK